MASATRPNRGSCTAVSIALNPPPSCARACPDPDGRPLAAFGGPGLSSSGPARRRLRLTLGQPGIELYFILTHRRRVSTSLDIGLFPDILAFSQLDAIVGRTATHSRFEKNSYICRARRSSRSGGQTAGHVLLAW